MAASRPLTERGRCQADSLPACLNGLVSAEPLTVQARVELCSSREIISQSINENKTYNAPYVAKKKLFVGA